ncbi:MAG: hypothetical protein AB7F43_01255 [Bacteriovoracia bacterium]
MDSSMGAYFSTLNAWVCCGLTTEKSIEQTKLSLAKYSADAAIIFEMSDVRRLVALLGPTCKLIFVTSEKNSEKIQVAESLGAEVHEELIWGTYRFCTKDILSNSGLLTTVAPGPTPFFLKGRGFFFLPQTEGRNPIEVEIPTSLVSKMEAFGVDQGMMRMKGKLSNLAGIQRPHLVVEKNV